MVRPMTDAYRLVHEAVRDLPNVTTRKMFGAEAFFHARRMFAFLREDQVVLKLPEGEREQLLETRAARPFLAPRGGGGEGGERDDGDQEAGAAGGGHRVPRAR